MDVLKNPFKSQGKDASVQDVDHDYGDNSRFDMPLQINKMFTPINQSSKGNLLSTENSNRPS